MTLSDDSSNSYPIDTESAVEMVRLIEQDRLFTWAIGSLFPEQIVLPPHAQILDLACGPGGWAIDVAYAYPDSEIAGIDISRTMIRYANATAKTQHRDTVTFGVMDILEELDFSRETFHLVNARFIAGIVSSLSWPRLLKECFRALKPGGSLCLTECEIAVSNSLAFQQLNGALYQALHTHQRTYSVDGQSMGITHMLAPLLQAAGFEHIRKQPFLLDASYGEPLYYPSYKNVEVTYALLKPYLIQVGVISNEAFDTLYEQTLSDIRQPSFVCSSFGLTAYGQKPPRTEKGTLDNDGQAL